MNHTKRSMWLATIVLGARPDLHRRIGQLRSGGQDSGCYRAPLPAVQAAGSGADGDQFLTDWRTLLEFGLPRHPERSNDPHHYRF
jgi:hypothetical protein